MWDFSRYTSGQRAFSFSRGTSEMTGAGTRARTRAGAGTGARASRTALKIRCKSSSEYLGILVLAGDFGPESLLSCSKISYSGGREESRKASKGATEGATEEQRREQRRKQRREQRRDAPGENVRGLGLRSSRSWR